MNVKLIVAGNSVRCSKNVNKEMKIDEKMSAGSSNKSSGVSAGVPTTPAAAPSDGPMDVDPVQLISDGLSAVTEGCRLPVKMAGPGDDWPMAEVIRFRCRLCIKRMFFSCVDVSLP